MPLTPDDRKNREHQGEMHVRFRFAASGLNSPERDLDREWLAELDEAARKRTEALQAEQTRLNRSTLKAPGADTQHDNEYVYMFRRLTRLEEFSRELP